MTEFTTIESPQAEINAIYKEVFGNGCAEPDPEVEETDFDATWEWDGQLPESVQKIRQHDPRVEQRLTQPHDEFKTEDGSQRYPSESECDQALANYLALGGCSGPDIASAIRWRRTILGIHLKHPAYYRRTVGNALSSAKEAKQRERSEQDGHHHETRADDEIKDDGRIEDPPPSIFFSDLGLDSSMLGQILMDEGDLQVGMDGRVFRYCTGVYNSDGVQFIKIRTRQILKNRYRKRHAAEVEDWCKARHETIHDAQPTEWINVKNGRLEWDTGTLLPHRPARKGEIPSVIQLPVEWNPRAKCPRFDRFVSEVLAPDMEEFLFEMIGLAMYPGNPFRTAMLLLGPGGNGKTVLLNIIKALLGGRRNVSAVPLQTLSENRFAAAEIYLKLANLCGDLDARTVTNSDNLKKMVGNDEMFAERKYGHPFYFTSFALPIFSANEPPLSADQSKGWFDRWVTVPMEVSYEEKLVTPGAKKADTELTKNLTTAAELEGILVKSVTGLRRAMHRGSLELPETVKAARGKYREKLDSVVGFVAEECDRSRPGWTPWVARPDLYAAYKTWMKDAERRPLSRNNFYERLLLTFPEIVVTKRAGIMGFNGIALKNPHREEFGL